MIPDFSRVHPDWNAPITGIFNFAGRYKISGTVTELGVLGFYRVVLFDRLTKMALAQTFSNSLTGYYQFNYLAYCANSYFVVAFDHGNNPQDAAIADLITPEPMP